MKHTEVVAAAASRDKTVVRFLCCKSGTSPSLKGQTEEGLRVRERVRLDILLLLLFICIKLGLKEASCCDCSRSSYCHGPGSLCSCCSSSNRLCPCCVCSHCHNSYYFWSCSTPCCLLSYVPAVSAYAARKGSKDLTLQK
jgi:hypothetical protein